MTALTSPQTDSSSSSCYSPETKAKIVVPLHFFLAIAATVFICLSLIFYILFDVVLAFVAICCFIVAVRRKSLHLLIPYLIYCIMMLVLLIISLFIGIYDLVAENGDGSLQIHFLYVGTGFTAAGVAVAALTFLFTVYTLIVVIQYYRILQRPTTATFIASVQTVLVPPPQFPENPHYHATIPEAAIYPQVSQAPYAPNQLVYPLQPHEPQSPYGTNQPASYYQPQIPQASYAPNQPVYPYETGPANHGTLPANASAPPVPEGTDLSEFLMAKQARELERYERH